MRMAIEDLRLFYGEPSGRLVRRLLAERLETAWGEAEGLDVLGLGYATPWLGAFVGARRLIAAMPSGQGVEAWPRGGRNRSVLVDDRALPFAAGSFDRVLVVHALEEADDVRALMAEAIRVLTPAGRIILVAAARGGLWARAESTPFGHGRPFTRRQLERLVREGGLEPAAWSQTLYVPPWPVLYGMADGFEQIGRRVVPGAAGLILLEATRHAYARVQPVGVAERVPLRGAVLQPTPAGRGASRALVQPCEHA
ncbi:methyltransferase domain-containing protein [Brevundimonas sp.]|uniref:class I SAM-dependent methyltransferase n=1 Tax=Brevundimonas sp. TaxID=1871086 RepID=UPI001E0A85E0|nr:methyltransferase domain-containing protein [Brevundimonas sp.]MBL0948753.1 methyltransferase domain-containing protein [Brevundimonas sp.]